MADVRRFRWRVVIVTLSGFFGVIFLLGGLANAGMLVYVCSRFGLFPVRPDTPSMNRFAMTPKNAGTVAAQVGAGALLLSACVASWRRLRKGSRNNDPATNPTAAESRLPFSMHAAACRDGRFRLVSRSRIPSEPPCSAIAPEWSSSTSSRSRNSGFTQRVP